MRKSTHLPTLHSRLVLFAILALFIFSLPSCGYKLASQNPSVVGDGTKTLKVKEVDNPTLEAWLPHSIRAALRDEINARHMARWVDSGPADYEISIKIAAFTGREAMHDRYDEPLLFDNRLSIVATVFDGATNKEIWRSGTIEYNNRMEQVENSRLSSQEVVVRVMNILADNLRNTF